jgi:hypothetical protein
VFSRRSVSMANRPPTTDDLLEQSISLAWSQWVALGVSGGAPTPNHAVDLEAAIVFAPILEETEPRLFDEIVDWCSRFGSDFVSVARLKQVVKLFDADHRDRFERFAAAVNANGGTKWPTRRVEKAASVSGKSRLRLDRASTIQLRARKIFGISARSDVIVSLLLSPPGWTHVGLLSSLAYTSRNLAEALNDLNGGGVLGAFRFGRNMYKLVKREPLAHLLAPIPKNSFVPWAQRLAIVAAVLAVVERTKHKSETIRAIELRKTVERVAKMAASVHEPPPSMIGGNPWPTVAQWLVPLLDP